MSKHTPTPWEIDTCAPTSEHPRIRGADYRKSRWATVASLEGRQKAEANAARIVACVNAMDGIDDPAAARVIIDEPQTQHARDMIKILEMSITRESGWEDLRDALLKKIGCGP